MNDYKWCVCDMDGTLLNSEKEISQEDKKALKKLQNDGVEVMIASGRVDTLLKLYIKELSLNGYIICCNGGLIKNIRTGKILYSKIINKDDVRRVLTQCFRDNLSFLVYTVDQVYSNEGNRIGEKYRRLNKTFDKDSKIPINFVDDKLMDSIDGMGVLKILLVCDERAEVIELERNFSKYNGLTVVSSGETLVDIMASNISKGNALEILSKKLNVSLSRVIAFGDNYNDIDMLKIVGMPIAMENAVEDARSAAKYVTKSCDDSGIAYAINNIIK
ncbi:Cof subfamily protein (haloacid dehalogenase superfamily) [Clostridium algifaecis]|uniref:Cof subfamily protein (Haloacid dehalogenase superfamily) n=1 Tax=Clostridium algifaecis TaxID=1472040 RepID=A0ABS4KRY6_9CLOT|nr:Cof-type HAD-IIB family hydrolase [Clostridium algifaecis]MBP2032181.1 Cof subfamily protein (haloacid dehalogenase superfamily) [Clostridium algifaecis]